MSPEQTTQHISVTVEPTYQPQQSRPDESYYFWTYTVTLKNLGEETVQLVSRHWIITDEHQHVEEVQGEGVVGQQPVLEPGESFVYTSACPLSTPSGSMHGTYQMVTEEGEPFDVAIPHFELISER